MIARLEDVDVATALARLAGELERTAAVCRAGAGAIVTEELSPERAAALARQCAGLSCELQALADRAGLPGDVADRELAAAARGSELPGEALAAAAREAARRAAGLGGLPPAGGA